MQGLNVTQREFLKILESFTYDKEYQLPGDFQNLTDLWNLSAEHQMVAAVYEKIRRSAVCADPENVQLLGLWKRSAMKDIMLQIQRAEGFLRVYEKLREAGVKPLVVKGCICRNLYTMSDYRISGDEDMLIRKEEFELCDQILQKEGLLREELDMEHLPYEIPYRNPKNGVYIELHFSLFAEEAGAYGHLNREFCDVFENCISETIQGKQVWTLAPKDHMFYLICHSFKHFLHGGFGLRQVCDMIKMAEHYGPMNQWKQLVLRLEALHMKKYWDALLKIGVKYLGFRMEQAAYPIELWQEEIDCEPMLIDLLSSGIYGGSTDERKHSANMTLTAAEKGKKDTTGSILNSLFPPIHYMKAQFSWLNRHPWLLPVAYGIRILRYLKSLRKKQDEASGVQIGMERVELLRKYGIIM